MGTWAETAPHLFISAKSFDSRHKTPRWDRKSSARKVAGGIRARLDPPDMPVRQISFKTVSFKTAWVQVFCNYACQLKFHSCQIAVRLPKGKELERARHGDLGALACKEEDCGENTENKWQHVRRERTAGKMAAKAAVLMELQQR